MASNSRRRLWLFRLIAAIGIPLLLLLLAEGVLRIAGYGVDSSYLHRVRHDDRKVLRNNPHFFDLFFPPHLLPAALPFSLPAQKPTGTFRIALLGGSAALGVPEPAYGMGPVLQEQLRHRYRGVDIEVLNLANTAINSHVVREIAKGALELEPDLFVVYLGNNEVVGPYGAGTVFTPLAPSLPAIRAGLALRRTRVGQLLQNAFGSASEGEDGPKHWRGMEMFLEQQVPADHPRLQTVYANFEANLEAICDVAHGAGVPVVLSTVGVNFRHCAPFASLEGDAIDAAARDALAAARERGNEALGTGDLRSAQREYEQALGAAPSNADLHYRIGRLALSAGQTERGRDHLIDALELDTLRFRADRRVQEIIREVAARRRDQRVVLADAAESLAVSSPAGLPGREFLWEHVHLDLAGNQRVVEALLPAVESLLPARLADRRQDDRLLGIEELATRMAYTPWNRSQITQQVGRLLQKPPFSDQSDHAEQMARLEREFERLQTMIPSDSLETYWTWHEDAMQRNPGDWMRTYRAAAYRMDALQDPAGAEPLWEGLVARLPHFPAAYNELARSLAAQGRTTEAVELVQKSLALDPYQPEMFGNLAALLERRGDREGARRALERALEMEPDDRNLQMRLRRLEG